MQIAISNVLALMYWQGLQFFQGFNSRDFIWLLIGAVLAFVMIWGYSKRRRRWL
jgi:hypothetical protein